MRRTPDYDTGCKLKEKHVSKADATKAAIKRGKMPGGHWRLHAYKCSFCKYWHIGRQRHMPKDALRPYNKNLRRDIPINEVPLDN